MWTMEEYLIICFILHIKELPTHYPLNRRAGPPDLGTALPDGGGTMRSRMTQRFVPRRVGWVLLLGKGEVSEEFETERKPKSVSVEGSLFLPQFSTFPL